jgi:hypothetical protein
MRSVFILWVASFCVASSAQAQAMDMSNEAFRRAAVTSVLVDHAFENCENQKATSKGFSAEDRSKNTAWQKANGVAEIRARLNELMADADIRQSIEKVKASASSKFRGTIDACVFFRAAVKSPEAQFASATPEVLASLKKAGAGATEPVVDKPKAAVGKDTSSAPADSAKPAGKPSSATAVLAQIDSIGFDFRAVAGYGGVVMDTFPVVLFRNGDLLMDVSALADTGGLEAHKKSKPDEWQKWRRSGGKLQRTGSEGWRDLAYQVTYPRLPDDFRLNGKFNSTSGIGTAGESVVAYRQYRFLANGQVECEAGVGSNSKVANSTTVSKTVAPNRKGSYRVEGLTLRIAYEDGSNESYVLVTDPKDPRAIWLDGVGYTQARK